MNYIRWFNEIGAGDVGTVGGKGANLGEMTRAGLPVPPGFCLTANAYRGFIETTGASETIRNILAELKPDDPTDSEEKTARIRVFLDAQTMPPNIAKEILEGYHMLATELGAANPDEIPVAVRSSATAEDLPTASFAGQQDTYRNIRGDDELLANVKRCWASLWTARAVSYRVKQGFDHAQVAAEDLHEDEVELAAARHAVAAEACLFEAALGAVVPVQRLQVDAVDRQGGEHVAHEGVQHVRAVAAAPVLAQADGDRRIEAVREANENEQGWL